LYLNEPKFILSAINGEQNPPSVTIEFDGVTVTPVPTQTGLESVDFSTVTGETDLAARGWSFVRPVPAAVTYGASTATGASGVTIAQNSGELHEAQTPDAVNILTHDASGDWVATAELHMSAAPDGNWQKNLMALYEDDDNFADILYQWDNGLNLEFSTEVGGRRDMAESRDRVAVATPVTDLWLRLTRVGQTVTAAYSTVGAAGPFTPLGVPKTFTATNAKLALGTYAGTGKSTTVTSLDVTPYVAPPVIALESYDFRGKDATDLSANHWSWLNPNPAGVTYGSGGVDVETSTDGLWLGNTSDRPANILVHPVAGDWMATVELEATGLDNNYEQVVLGVYDDSNNYIKLARSAENGGSFQYAQETNGNGDLGSAVATAATHVWLRLLKTGDGYEAFTSTDGTSFTQLGWAFTRTFTDPRLMLATYKDAGGAASATVRYIDLQVTPPPNDTVTAFDFPNSEVDLTDARAGVQLAAGWTSSGTDHGSGRYLIMPSSVNTAGGQVTSGGILTAQATGTVEVTVEVTIGLATCRGTARYRIIPDGTGALTSVAAPVWDLATVAAHVGAAISVDTGTWSVTPGAVAYQWVVDGAPIAGATGSAYVPIAADAGKPLTVEVTASHQEFPPVTVTVGPVEVHAAMADKTALSHAIDAAEAVISGAVQTQYTARSWTGLRDAVTAALAVLSDEDATATVVEAAESAVRGAVLVPRADLSGLQVTLGVFDALSAQADLYTSSSWATLDGWIGQGRSLVAAPENVVTSEVTPILAGIQTAWAGLELVPDTAGLASLVEGIQALLADGRLVEAEYTAATWSVLASALSAAAGLVAAPTHQSAIDGAEGDLRAALAGLVPTVDQDALDDVIVLVEGMVAGRQLNEDSYTAGSWADLVAALSAARTAASQPVSQTAVDAAASLLRGALADLAPSVQTTGLRTAVEAIEALGLRASDYTADSWQTFTGALAAAKAQMSAPATATQEDIDAAAEALTGALAGLVRAASAQTPGGPADEPDRPDDGLSARDTSALAGLTAAAQGFVAGQGARLTVDSAAALAAAIARAQEVLAAPAAQRSQGDVDAVLGALHTAIASAALAAFPTLGDPGQVPNADLTQVVRVKVAQRAITVVKGKKATVAAYGYTASGRVAVTWKSSKPAVASVSAAGTVTAKKAGKATITATAGTKTARFVVTVVPRRPAVTVTSVKAAVPRTLTVGATKAITGTFAPARASGVRVTYTSSKPTVAAIDKAGMITAKAAGTAKITVKAGSATKVYTVRVTAV
ncbi:MAG: Ig-like domain-containing protein, partial [Bifidobacteriaceae bacterium]|nr:Ig-like domain-containing protein [Bifidobacteriaceae bacterium]